MALKEVVAKRVLEEILGTAKKRAGRGAWLVLVLDKLSTRIISSCCRMHEVMSSGVTIVEALDKEREPLPHLDAVYIMLPTKENIDRLIKDFRRPNDPKNLYKTIHLFFLEKCSPTNFKNLGDSEAAKRIKTLQEANMAFLPYESRVFSLDYPDAFDEYFTTATSQQSRDRLYENMADQLTTVCAMLGEYPAIRYWNDGRNRCEELAKKVQSKLDQFKADKRDLGQGPKQTSELIILDRGFDVVTPVLHELTYQAMVYDVLSVDKDTYTFSSTTVDGERKNKTVILDENDELWADVRHQHIADVSKMITTKFNEFCEKKKLKGTTDPEISVKDLARHIRKVPQYQKEASQYSLHLNMVGECMKLYKRGLSKVCQAEQDLAVGYNTDGEKVTDPTKLIMPLLFDRTVKVPEKIRLLCLHLLHLSGLSKDEFERIMQHSEIPLNERKSIINLMHLGVPIINGQGVKKGKSLTRIEREEERFTDARWNPVVRDIVELVQEGKLDESYCTYIRGKPRAGSTQTGLTSSIASSSVRQRWNWIPKADEKESKSAAKKDCPTIFIFVVGGVTYSEMRIINEAAKQSKTHDFVIGSTHIITPKRFLQDLRHLASFTDQ